MLFFETFIIKTIVSAFLGFIIGIQRERVGKPAGSRTMAMVALGATVFTILSRDGFVGLGTQLDPTRIAAQVVVGMGFLGAGIIIFHEDKVKGLTTASTLWVVAAMGMLVGAGLLRESVFLALLIFLLLQTSEFQKKKRWLKN